MGMETRGISDFPVFPFSLHSSPVFFQFFFFLIYRFTYNFLCFYYVPSFMLGINKPKPISSQLWGALVGTDEQTIEHHVINKISTQKAVGETVPERWWSLL